MNTDVQTQTISYDWYGEPGWTPAFSLQANESEWRFTARFQADLRLHPDSEAGRCCEGLWQYDVAECFIANPHNGHYLEINLAPNAAWWMMTFNAPRQRYSAVNLIDCPSISSKAWKTEHYPYAQLVFPSELLALALGNPSEYTANICFILGHSPRRYFSLAALPGAHPNFHQPAHFLPISRVIESS